MRRSCAWPWVSSIAVTVGVLGCGDDTARTGAVCDRYVDFDHPKACADGLHCEAASKRCTPSKVPATCDADMTTLFVVHGNAFAPPLNPGEPALLVAGTDVVEWTGAPGPTVGTAPWGSHAAARHPNGDLLFTNDKGAWRGDALDDGTFDAPILFDRTDQPSVAVVPFKSSEVRGSEATLTVESYPNEFDEPRHRVVISRISDVQYTASIWDPARLVPDLDGDGYPELRVDSFSEDRASEVRPERRNTVFIASQSETWVPGNPDTLTARVEHTAIWAEIWDVADDERTLSFEVHRFPNDTRRLVVEHRPTPVVDGSELAHDVLDAVQSSFEIDYPREIAMVRAAQLGGGEGIDGLIVLDDLARIYVFFDVDGETSCVQTFDLPEALHELHVYDVDDDGVDEIIAVIE